MLIVDALNHLTGVPDPVGYSMKKLQMLTFRLVLVNQHFMKFGEESENSETVICLQWQPSCRTSEMCNY